MFGWLVCNMYGCHAYCVYCVCAWYLKRPEEAFGSLELELETVLSQ